MNLDKMETKMKEEIDDCVLCGVKEDVCSCGAEYYRNLYKRFNDIKENEK